MLAHTLFGKIKLFKKTSASCNMKLVIDASNLRKGGGVTHLQEVLNAADFAQHGFSKVQVWAPEKTLDRIGEVPNLERRSHPLIEKAGWSAFWFRKHHLDRLIEPGTNLLWAPGGTCISQFRPYVTMVRNFLPFDKPERDRFKYSKAWLRYIYLYQVQLASFRKACGLIHISYETERVINHIAKLPGVAQTTIHHGLNDRFLLDPRPPRDFEQFTNDDPVRLLYVSPINHYKHQDKLVQAAALLRKRGIPICLDLVGPAFPAAETKFERVLAQEDPAKEWVRWHGEVPYSEIQNYYRNADVYACMSTCETFGMILLEAMASGLPILCSNRSALPEINGGTCPEVDPEDVEAVAAGLEQLIRDKALRERCARAAHERAKTFTWEKCADQTFKFLAECAKR